LRADWSEWHTPAARTLIRTSPGPGGIATTSSRISIFSSLPIAWSTAARMTPPPCFLIRSFALR
jgi:hypothetical protein